VGADRSTVQVLPRRSRTAGRATAAVPAVALDR